MTLDGSQYVEVATLGTGMLISYGACRYQHAWEAESECGRFPAASRPSTPGVSFLPDFVGFTPDSGPTAR